MTADQPTKRVPDSTRWTWESNQRLVGTWLDVTTLELEHVSEDVEISGITLSMPIREGVSTIDIQIKSNAANLRVNIDPRQSHAQIGKLSITGEFDHVTISSPIHPGDPMELGTAEISEILVSSAKTVILGGDELWLGTLDIDHFIDGPLESDYERDDAWDGIEILDESTVVFAKRRRALALTLGSRCCVKVAGPTSIFLGQIGSNSEIMAADDDLIYIEDWKVNLCSGSERIHFSGVASFGFGLLRRVRTRVEETTSSLIGSYNPVDADELPLDSSESKTTQSDWVRSHFDFVSRYCSDPGTLADARWLTYEDQRKRAPRWSGERIVLACVLRPLGYGLKAGPPLRLWVAICVVIVTLFSHGSGHHIDWGGGTTAWHRGLLMWTEAAILPSGLLSLSTPITESVLTISGTGLRIARLAASVPFAAFLFAAQARLRLPKFSDAKV